MSLYYLIVISFLRQTFALPNGVEVPIKPEYSNWFNVFYKSSSLIPLFKSKEKTYYAGRYFRVTFLQAHLFCKLMHMHLMTISSKEENEEIRSLLEKKYSYSGKTPEMLTAENNNVTGDFWTSGTRMLDGKNWIWMSTARYIEYKNWGPGQPNNKNDHCILLIKNINNFVWDDRNCNCRFFFICEKPVDEFSLYISKKHESEIRKYYRTYFD
ncbi:hypothetical protein NQ314_001772 [Rhamnusium bicolor]|uniref:C-type lectin domain-containing protein n=1 Tax=Rhamnusium bicolor TaxID=1586634 RepID=A0AAV8ZSL0_9CUCU|nr:hypothetical protein NQ314_001772 [Rhamnusium bicolor]